MAREKPGKLFQYRGVWITPIQLRMRCTSKNQPHPDTKIIWWTCELNADSAYEVVRTRPVASREFAIAAAKSWIDAMCINLGIHNKCAEKLEDLALSVRTTNILRGEGILTLAALLVHTPQELIDMPVGEHALREIKDKLLSAGLTLKE